MKIYIQESNTIANVTERRDRIIEIADFTLAGDRIAASLATAAGQIPVSTAAEVWAVLAAPGASGLVLTSNLTEQKKMLWAALVTGGKAMLTNKSGSNLAKGAFAIIDTANDSAFKTTTSINDPLALGVLAEAINNDAQGLVTILGLEVDILVQGNVTRGNYLVASATAGRAADGGASPSAGAIGRALTGWTGAAGTVTALIFRDAPFTGSDWGTRIIEIPVLDKDTTLAVGDWAGGATFTVPSWLDGYEVIGVEGDLLGAQSSSGSVTVNVYNITDSVDILSSAISISANTWRGTGTVNSSYKSLATGDRIRIDIDGAGTGAKGLNVPLAVRKP